MTKAFKIGIAVSALVLSTATFATNGAELFQQKEQQPMKKQLNHQEVESKQQKYDYSLFKFVTYQRKEESDSSHQKVENTPTQTPNRRETAELYDIPRSFFMFS
ncbi:MAG: hypothetical protein WD530_04740 [Vicingaceae bacterium]